jgi:F-box-like
MASNIRYQDNIPDEIKQKIQLSVEQDASILDLEKQLQEMRVKQTDLLRELEPFRFLRIDIGQGSSYEQQVDGIEAFINRCPTEILIPIFQYSVAQKHTRIRSLLLICRRWYHIVMDSPTLWTNMQISQPRLNSHNAYIAACNERSRGLLMDLNLDFSYFPSYREYVMDQIQVFLKTICDPREDYPRIHYDTIEWNFLPPEYSRQVQELLNCLSGPKGEEIRRWRSLIWKLPSSRGIAAFLFFHLRGAAPHLKTLKILGGPSQFHEKDVPIKQDFHTSALRRLQATSAISISQFNACASSLRELDIVVQDKIHNLRSISSFPLLQVLKINCNPWNPITVQPFLISLPQLIELTLAGNVEMLCPLQLDFPILQKLDIINRKSFQKLPRLSPTHVNWEQDSNSWDVEIKQAIETILRMSSKISTLTVQVHHAKIAQKVVEQYQSEGHIPAFTHLRVKVGKKVVDIEDSGALGI